MIRGLAEDEIARLDADADRLGLSRNEYVRRRLSADSRAGGGRVTVADLEGFARRHADLGDETVMAAAWR